VQKKRLKGESKKKRLKGECKKKRLKGESKKKRLKGECSKRKRLEEDCKRTGSANEEAQGGINTLLFAFLLRNSTFGVWKKSQLSWVNSEIQGEMPSD
jgi:hypothetical protein